MRRGAKLSLLVLVIVVASVFFMGFIGVSCEIWSHAALSSAKKVGIKLVLRSIYHSDLWELPIDRFPYLEKFIKAKI
jgi:hypothetical protein